MIDIQIGKGRNRRSGSNYVTLIRRLRDPIKIEEYKSDDEGSVRRLGTAKRVFGAAGGILAAVLLFMMVNGYLIPYLRSRNSENTQVITAHFKNEDGEAGVSEEEYLPVSYDKTTGLAVFDDDFNLFIINSDYPETKDYAPETEEYAGIPIHKNIAPTLRDMVNAADEDGVELKFTEGYISFKQQSKMYRREVQRLEESGYTHLMAGHKAKDRVPYPGESDFQTGLDVRLEGSSETIVSGEVYSWLNRNAADYGFVFRYPQDKTVYTGRGSDYTVLRYVGRDNALRMRQLSMCLEEYQSYVYSR